MNAFAGCQCDIGKHGKSSKCSKTLLFVFSNKTLLVRIIDNEDTDQTASSETVCSGSNQSRYALFV